MELNIKQKITADDFLKGISWFGETEHDDNAVEKLAELNELVSDIIQKVFFLQKNMEDIFKNQHNASARHISDEAKKFLVNVVKMAVEEENWSDVDRMFNGIEVEEEVEKFFLYNPETKQYLVELIFGDKKWLREGELDSVPRTWVFTEQDIVKKFGSENLKYKLSVEDWEKLKGNSHDK